MGSECFVNFQQFVAVEMICGCAYSEIADKIFTMSFQVIAVIMVLAVADYAYQTWQTTQDLMMT